MIIARLQTALLANYSRDFNFRLRVNCEVQTHTAVSKLIAPCDIYCKPRLLKHIKHSPSARRKIMTSCDDINRNLFVFKLFQLLNSHFETVDCRYSGIEQIARDKNKVHSLSNTFSYRKTKRISISQTQFRLTPAANMTI